MTFRSLPEVLPLLKMHLLSNPEMKAKRSPEAHLLRPLVARPAEAKRPSGFRHSASEAHVGAILEVGWLSSPVRSVRERAGELADRTDLPGDVDTPRHEMHPIPEIAGPITKRWNDVKSG